ncbi:MAG: hypothetical protein IJE10_10455 [Clostridia bacterium]|nr:hypothetical protein [Clostridia bacterium]
MKEGSRISGGFGVLHPLALKHKKNTTQQGGVLFMAFTFIIDATDFS